MTQREEFEKWAGLRDFELSSAPVNYHPTYLEYDSEVTESSWQAYQAATQSNIEALKEVREAVVEARDLVCGVVEDYCREYDRAQSRPLSAHHRHLNSALSDLNVSASELNRLIGEA